MAKKLAKKAGKKKESSLRIRKEKVTLKTSMNDNM